MKKDLDFSPDFFTNSSSIINEREYNKLDEEERFLAVENSTCPHCGGRVSCKPVNERNCSVECEDCGTVFYED